MANIIRAAVDNPEELLNAGAYGPGAVIRLQSAATSAGPFASVTTVPIVSGTRSYTLYDQAGTITTWYRTRYENSGGTLLSDFSALFQVGSSGIVDLPDVKRRLNIDPTDTRNDEDILDLISDVTSWVQSTTGRSFAPDPTTVYTFDGFDALEGGRMLPVPRGIQSVSLLEVALYTGAAWVTVPAGDYFLRPDLSQRDPGWPATELWMSNIPSSGNTTPVFPPGFANIRVTGVFGWASIPGDIHDVTLNLVISSFRTRSAGGTETVRVGMSGERTYDRQLSYKDSRTIARYTIKTLELIG